MSGASFSDADIVSTAQVEGSKQTQSIQDLHSQPLGPRTSSGILIIGYRIGFAP